MKNFTTLLVTDLARDDLQESVIFYEKQAPKLGVYFKDSIISDLEGLLFYAGIHEIHFGCYRMLAKRFPFSIYYRIDDEKVIVHAILDDRRDPKSHQNRLIILK